MNEPGRRAILTIIGVMGGGVCDEDVAAQAARIGTLIAERGWVLLTGGRDAGVMSAASRGAKDAGGLVVGVLPDTHVDGASSHVDIPILTGMGDARNAINVLSSRVVVALFGGAGTLSEIALALSADRPVVALGIDVGPLLEPYAEAGRLVKVGNPEEAVAAVERFLAEDAPRWADSE